ncbi:hypothetical protein ACQB60_33860 [Actinomycetota bacterium Odt1-20B]
MPTAIAVTGPDLVLPSPDRHTPSAAVLQSAVAAARDPRGAAQDYSLDRAITEMHTLIEHHGYVIVLCPASAPAPVVQRLHAVRSVLESDRIALLRPELPPLGLAVLALQLRQLSICDFSPGVLACAGRLLSHYIYAGALLGSVAKLDRVPVSLQSHAKSWVPGAQFAVLATPRPELVRVNGKGGGDACPAGPGFATRLLYAQGQLAPDWVAVTLASQWNVQGVSDVRLPAESSRWWATGKLVEFAAAIPDISVLYQLVSSVRREECHWCGLELIGDRCAFCAAPLPPPDERPTASPVTASAPASVLPASRDALPRGVT